MIPILGGKNSKGKQHQRQHERYLLVVELYIGFANFQVSVDKYQIISCASLLQQFIASEISWCNIRTILLYIVINFFSSLGNLYWMKHSNAGIIILYCISKNQNSKFFLKNTVVLYREGKIVQ